VSQVEGELKHGLKIGDTVHTHFVLRPALTGDLFDAEEIVPANRALAYRAALLGCQLVRMGSYTGPFDLALLRKLHTADFDILVEAQQQVERQGVTAEKK
jgi:phage FluMu protein gp41